VSEIDKKGKKKKGTLGVGNGAIFFASDSDKVHFSMFHVNSGGTHKHRKDPRAKMAGRGH
jgi:hypothetical protein